MKHVSLLIKPSSSLCNLKCTYCFYNDISSIREVKSYGFMSEEVVTKMIDNVYRDLEDSDHLSLVFQGGEPTLVGIEYYKKLTEYVKRKNSKVEVHYSIQTNGFTIDSDWCELFKEHNFLVGLSIDGSEKYHDQTRRTWAKEGSYNRIMDSKKLLDLYGVDYNIITVLTSDLSKDPNSIIDFLEKSNVEYVQFIPCLEDLDRKGSHSEALTPERFYYFYSKIFEYWINQLEHGKYRSIKLFDDIFNLFVNREITACGMTGSCQVQLVVEGDGSTFPCDFYVLDEYKLGNIKESTIYDLAGHENAKRFLNENRSPKDFCKTCPYLMYCNGGCKRMDKNMYINEENTFCGYQSLLNIYLERLDDIVEYLNKI